MCLLGWDMSNTFWLRLPILSKCPCMLGSYVLLSTLQSTQSLFIYPSHVYNSVYEYLYLIFDTIVDLFSCCFQEDVLRQPALFGIQVIQSPSHLFQVLFLTLLFSPSRVVSRFLSVSLPLLYVFPCHFLSLSLPLIFFLCLKLKKNIVLVP